MWHDVSRVFMIMRMGEANLGARNCGTNGLYTKSKNSLFYWIDGGKEEGRKDQTSGRSQELNLRSTETISKGRSATVVNTHIGTKFRYNSHFRNDKILYID